MNIAFPRLGLREGLDTVEFQVTVRVSAELIKVAFQPEDLARQLRKDLIDQALESKEFIEKEIKKIRVIGIGAYEYEYRKVRPDTG